MFARYRPGPYMSSAVICRAAQLTPNREGPWGLVGRHAWASYRPTPALPYSTFVARLQLSHLPHVQCTAAVSPKRLRFPSNPCTISETLSPRQKDRTGAVRVDHGAIVGPSCSAEPSPLREVSGLPGTDGVRSCCKRLSLSYSDPPLSFIPCPAPCRVSENHAAAVRGLVLMLVDDRLLRFHSSFRGQTLFLKLSWGLS